jgi:soluble lytic murein transglycosylase-like protein
MKLTRLFGVLNLALLLAGSLHARESAVLRNGFSISHDHRRPMGSFTRLFLSTSEDEYVDISSADVVSYEPDVDPPPLKLDKAPGTPANAHLDLKQIVDKAATVYQLDADFIHAVIHAESNGNAAAISPKGAQGLMQLMPQTATKLGVKNSFDPAENINAGTRYLRELLARYHNDPVRALAAYNAGAGRVERYHGIPPYRETRAYVANVIRDFNRRKLDQERAAKLAKQSAQRAAAKVSDGN